MDRRVALRAAGVGLAIAAVATGAAVPAAAGTASPAHARYVSSVVLAAHPDHDIAADAQARIDALTAWAGKLASKAAALSSTTAVAGRARLHLLGERALVQRAIAAIDRAIASSSLTAAQQAQLASVAATLSGVAAKLTTILANSPAPATVKSHLVTFSRDALFDPTRHHCDGTWSGFGSGDGWHHWWH